MNQEVITVEAVVKKKISEVWEKWALPEHITKWNFASDDWHCPNAENDLRAGGKMRSRMEAKDGSSGFDFEAIYDEVVHESKAAYTMPDGRHVITTFEDLGGETKVVTIFDPEQVYPADMQKAGWQAILDNFKKYTEETK